MAKHAYSIVITASGQVISTSPTVTDDTEIDISITLAAATINQAVAQTFTLTAIKSLVIQSTTGDLTIKTNSTGAPTDTVVLTAGQVLVWSSVAGIGTDPFTGNITTLYLSSTAGTTFNLYSVVHT